MDPFTAISLGISAASGVAKMIDGFNQKKAAKEKMRKLEAAALPLNAFEALQVPTEGIELQREELQRQSAAQTQMLQQAGTRAIAGNIGQLNQAQQQGYRKLGAELSDMIYDRDIAIAEENANIEAVKEARLQGQIAQAGEQLAGSRQQIFSAAGDLASIAGSFGAMREQSSADMFGDAGAAQRMRQEKRAEERYYRQTDRNTRKTINRASRSGGAQYSFLNNG